MENKKDILDDFYIKIRGMDYVETEHFLSELESRLLRLNLFYKSCEAKVERIDPFSEEFESLVEKILETKSDIGIVSKKVNVTRITAVQRKDRYIIKNRENSNG